MADTGREGRFSELIRRAINDGPQTVTHRGADIAVVLSIEDYRRLTGAKRSFLDHLLSGPKLDDEFVNLINERSFLHLTRMSLRSSGLRRRYAVTCSPASP